MHSPKSLFKYLPPDRADFLSSGLLRFTPLGAFNDPFDGRPHISALAPEQELLSAIDESIRNSISLAFDRLPPETRKIVGLADVELLAGSTLALQRQSIYQRCVHLLPSIVNIVHEKADATVGALCLSEVPDNLLMWAHYAASHTGFVVEFDGHHKYFNSAFTATDKFRHIRRVLYRDARPRGNLSSLLGEMFTVKSSHWAYEREWRILQPLPDASKVIDASPFPIHLFPLPFDSIASIVFGARMTSQARNELSERVRRNSLLAHITLRQAVPDDAHFLLRIEKAA